jgi:hypothetical protein
VYREIGNTSTSDYTGWERGIATIRLLIISRQDWEDHLPDCLRQQAKMRRIGLIA